MLSMLLTYHDALYLATELGLLAVVLLAFWFLPGSAHRHPNQS